jgi:hypothetical protein
MFTTSSPFKEVAGLECKGSITLNKTIKVVFLSSVLLALSKLDYKSLANYLNSNNMQLVFALYVQS